MTTEYGWGITVLCTMAEAARNCIFSLLDDDCLNARHPGIIADKIVLMNAVNVSINVSQVKFSL